MSKETIKTGIATQPYDYGSYMAKMLINYTHGKMSFGDKKPDIDLSNEWYDKVRDLSRIILIKESRIKILYMSIFAEIDWLRENKHDVYKQNEHQIYATKTILMEQASKIHAEFKKAWAICHSIENIPYPNGSTADKAVRYYYKHTRERFTGKNSPVDIMINNDILITPFLGYSTYLTRQNKTIWEYAKELYPMMHLLIDDPFGTKEADLDKHGIHKNLYPVIKYVYTNNKLNFINNRVSITSSNEEREAKRKAEAEEKAKARIKAKIETHMREAFRQHNKWVNDPHPDSLAGYPRSYSTYVREHDNIGSNWVILAVAKNKAGAYIHGYMNDSEKSSIGFNLKNPIIFDNIEDTKVAIREFKETGVILDGEAVCV